MTYLSLSAALPGPGRELAAEAAWFPTPREKQQLLFKSQLSHFPGTVLALVAVQL